MNKTSMMTIIITHTMTVAVRSIIMVMKVAATAVIAVDGNTATENGANGINGTMVKNGNTTTVNGNTTTVNGINGTTVANMVVGNNGITIASTLIGATVVIPLTT